MKSGLKIGAVLACLQAAFVLGCASTGGGALTVGKQNFDQPVSQQKVTSEGRRKAKIHTELGALYLQDGRLPVALQEAQIAIDSDPSYALSYNLLGLVKMTMGDNVGAEASFRQAFSIAPNDPEIHNNFGWFLCSSGKEEQSLSHFELAYRHPLYQTPALAYTNAGLCLWRMKQYSKAEGLLNIALRYDGANTQALFTLGEIYLATNRYEEARIKVADLQKMVDPFPEIVWLALRLERAAGDRDAEMKYATQLRRRFADSPEYQKLIKGQYE